MLQKETTEQVVSTVQRVKRVLGNSELANVIALMEIRFWGKLEYSVSNLETHWLYHLLNFFARL